MRAAKKTPGKRPARQRVTPTVPNAALVEQPHGGALKVGNPGNSGGSGRPPSELRARLRGAADKRLKILEEIADGKVTYVLDAEGRPDLKQTIERVPSPADRIKALDTLLKYGLGTQSEQKVDATVKVAGVVILPALVPE